MTIKATKETNGRFTVWNGNLTIIDHSTGRPIQFKELEMIAIIGRINCAASCIVAELSVPAHKYQRV